MKRLVFLAFLLSACDLGNICTGGSTCTSGPVGPSAVKPSPSPEPDIRITPTPKPEPTECTMTSIDIISEGGDQLKVKDLVRLDATPYRNSTKLPDYCNVGARVLWLTGPDTVCLLEGDVRGFNPMLRAVGVGRCTLSATIGNVGSGQLVITVTK